MKSRKDKIKYLSRFIRARRKYEVLNQQLKSVESIDINKIKSTVHKSMAERIHDKDKAYEKMMMTYIEIDSIIGDNAFLSYLFLLDYSIEDIAKVMNVSKTKATNAIFKSLDELDI